MKLFKLHRCEHDWELLNKAQYVSREGEIPYRLDYVYICKKCLKKKVIKVGE